MVAVYQPREAAASRTDRQWEDYFDLVTGFFFGRDLALGERFGLGVSLTSIMTERDEHVGQEK